MYFLSDLYMFINICTCAMTMASDWRGDEGLKLFEKEQESTTAYKKTENHSRTFHYDTSVPQHGHLSITDGSPGHRDRNSCKFYLFNTDTSQLRRVHLRGTVQNSSKLYLHNRNTSITDSSLGYTETKVHATSTYILWTPCGQLSITDSLLGPWDQTSWK